MLKKLSRKSSATERSDAVTRISEQFGDVRVILEIRGRRKVTKTMRRDAMEPMWSAAIEVWPAIFGLQVVPVVTA